MRIVLKCQKFSLRMLISICLIFCQFQPGVADKSVAYEKNVCLFLVVQFLLGINTRGKFSLNCCSDTENCESLFMSY